MSHTPNPRSRLLSSLISLVIIACVAWGGLTYGSDIYDAVVASQYQPSSAMQEVIDQLELTDKGKRLLYASQPSLQDKAEFNTSCQSTERTAAILGCYHVRRIYVYNVQNQELRGAKPVATAHELLHAAYERLSASDRQHVDELVEAEYQKIKNQPVIASMVQYYEQAEPGERVNELHSIIGSQVGNIGSKLEEYYSQYFRNRAVIVALSDTYQTVFDKVEQEAKSLRQSISSEATQLKADQTQYKADIEQLLADIKTFNTRAQNGAFQSQIAFQRARSQLVSRQKQLEQRRLSLNQRADTYNANVTRLNQLSIRAQELNQSINGIEQPKGQL